jgi:hypothetical protein
VCENAIKALKDIEVNPPNHHHPLFISKAIFREEGGARVRRY